MFQRILVPLDGSARAERALPLAIRLAHASGGTIVLVSVVLPPLEIGEYGVEDEAMGVPPNAYEKRLTRAEQYLQRTTEQYASDLVGITVEQEVETGSTASTLFSIARLEHIDLIVMCSHGAHALLHWIFRSIAREAVHSSPVPMLVLKEESDPFLEACPGKVPQMLVPLDGSPLAEAALEPALQLLIALAMPGQGELHLVQVVDLPPVEGKPLLRAYELGREQEHSVESASTYLAEVRARLLASLPTDSQIVITSSIMVSNHVSRTLIEMTGSSSESAEEHRYDFLAMATHGRTGFQLLRLGSVTEQVLGATELPLLIVRPSPQKSHQKPEAEQVTLER